MTYSESLARRIRHQLAETICIEEKKMFGGIGFLLNGNMCVGVWKDALIARVGPEQYLAAMKKRYAGEFDITGRAMKGWVLVAPEGIEDDRHLQDWLSAALNFTRTLPVK